MKKIISFVLSAIMALSFLPTAARTEGNMSLTELFSQNSYIYNHNLGVLAAELSVLAYNRYAPQPDTWIRNRLLELGFAGGNIFTESYTAPRTDDHYVAYAIAHKPIEINGVNRNLIFIAIRGTNAAEWNSNFEIGDGLDHYGFKRATERLRADLESRISHFKAEDNIMLVTGHSRGAAVANLLAADLNRSGRDIILSENLHAYTFATPNVTRRPDYGNHPNIFNFINAEDLISYIPLSRSGWNYRRNGMTFLFPTRNIVPADVAAMYNQKVREHFIQLTNQHLLWFSNHTHFRRGGYASLVHWTEVLHELAPTVYDFYNTEHIIDIPEFPEFSGSLTVREFMNFIAAAMSGDGDLLMDIFPLLMFPNPFQTAVLLFLVGGNPDHIMRDRGLAHDDNYYWAWMLALADTEQNGNFSLTLDNKVAPLTRIRIYGSVDARVYNSQNQLVADNIPAMTGSPINYHGIYTLPGFDTNAPDMIDPNIIYIYTSVFDTYTIRLTATGGGELNFIVEDIDFITGAVINRKEFIDENLYAGKELFFEIVDVPTVRLMFVEDETITVTTSRPIFRNEFLIIAVYNEIIMVDATFNPRITSGNVYEFTSDNLESANTIKVMLWSAENLRPLGAAKTLRRNGSGWE
ncbi:MAG: hypothetical protein FWE04_04355 [Oscillospiraceae bacterium]|nr:hypothetical protein [Oscillospiraceae bacterium]